MGLPRTKWINPFAKYVPLFSNLSERYSFIRTVTVPIGP